MRYITTAQKIKNIDDYTDSLIEANRLAHMIYNDYINETTTITFSDGSVLLFCGISFEKYLIN